jgi:thymidylate synthase ThyX
MPLGTYSEMYWKADLRNIFNFISLRSDPHAQHEIRVYSDAMLEMLEPIAPICVAAFIDYQLKGKSLSRMELDTLRELYKVCATESVIGSEHLDPMIEDTMKEAGAGAREIREFLDTLKRERS